MLEVNTKEIEIKEKTGTWSQSRKLLIDCESNHSYGYSMKLSKNLKKIYKVMAWLEEKNKIVNHKIEKNIKIFVPKELDDYIIIIASEIPLAKEAKYEKEDFEIKYDDTVIFQHNRQPKIDSKVSEMIILNCLSKNEFYDDKKIKYVSLAEDYKSADMSVEEIVKRNPCLEEIFRDVLHFKNIIRTEEKEFKNYKISTRNSKIINDVQEHVDFLLSEIVEKAKIDMLNLMKICSMFEWQKLAIKLYNKFCSDDSSDFKEDPFLNKLFVEHEKTVKCINDFKKRFIKYLRQNYYDINNLNILKFHKSIYGETGENGVNRPIFGNFPQLKKILFNPKISELKKIPEYLEAIKGPTICFHDIQGFNVSAIKIKIKNGMFFCKLVFDFYDHFGLDSRDIDKFGNKNLVGKGFQAWYILQHLNEYNTGCKAFVSHAIYEENLELKIEE